MKRSNSPRRRPAAKAVAVTVNARTLLLAGVGAVINGRRQAEAAVAELSALPQRARAGVDAARKVLRTETRKIEKQAKTTLAPVQAKVEQFVADATRLGQEVQSQAAARLNPLLAKAKLPVIPAVRKARKPAAKKVAAKKAVRKTARKAARKAA